MHVSVELVWIWRVLLISTLSRTDIKTRSKSAEAIWQSAVIAVVAGVPAAQ